MSINKIRIEEMKPGLSMITMRLTPVTEQCFKQTVFPYLFDGKTTGVRTPGIKRTKYTFLVYDQTLVHVFKQVLYNEIAKANGQLN